MNLEELPASVVEFRKTAFALIEAETSPIARALKLSELYHQELELWKAAYPERKAEIQKRVKQSLTKTYSNN